MLTRLRTILVVYRAHLFTAVIVLVVVTSAATQNSNGGLLRITASSNSSAQELPKVVISPLDTPGGDEVAQAIATTVYQSLALMLHLTGAFNIENAYFLDPTVSYQRSVLYYQHIGASIGIFGSVTSNASGAYTIAIEYWRAADPSARPEKFSSTFRNVFAVFGAADRLAVDVASAAAGRKLSVGTVVIRNVESLHSYAIYADGQLVARNRPQVRLLTGKRTIIVAVPGPVGDEPVQTFHTYVKAGQTIALALTSTAVSSKTPSTSILRAPKVSAANRSPAQKKARMLHIKSSPEGATVLLDGKRIGATPLVLSSVSVGSHQLNLSRRYFMTVQKDISVKTGEIMSVNVKLSVDKRDPAIEQRMIHGEIGASLMWSTIQFGSIIPGILAQASGLVYSQPPYPQPSVLIQDNSTSSFWTARPSPFWPNFNEMLLIDTNIIFSRIGDRLTGNRLLTVIGDAIAATAALSTTIEFAPSWTNPSAQLSSTSGELTGGKLLTAGFLLFVADVAYDAVSSGLASSNTNSRLLEYVSQNGTLPPERLAWQPHRIIIATGGGSFVRGGYDLPILPNYLSLEATGGVGATSLRSFGLVVSGNADVSYNPWGTRTGHMRPEIFVGVRASTDFSNTSVAPEFGTGNDWVGRNFDIFTRGGIDYDLIGQHWDQFFTIGTRIN